MKTEIISEGTSLLSMVLLLRCCQDDPRRRSLGHAAKKLFIDVIKSQDSRLADEMEEANQKPYTVSILMNAQSKQFRESRRFVESWQYILRFTALTRTIVESLRSAIESGPLSPGSTVELDYLPFEVEGVAAHPAHDPLCDQTDYGSLAYARSYGVIESEPKITLEIFSPMTFKKGNSSGDYKQGKPIGKKDLFVPMPYPELLFGSLLDRWNTFSQMPPLPAEWRDVFRNEIVFSRYDLHTNYMGYKGGSTKIGCLGRVTYESPRAGPDMLTVLNLLADFAFYSGAGMMTTMGFGQVKRI